jgi:hypothetical protein
VLVWIYGGGYAAVDKSNDGMYDPAGLIRASQVTGDEGIVFVAFNYRVYTRRSCMKVANNCLIVRSVWLAWWIYISIEWNSERWAVRSTSSLKMGTAIHPSLWRRPN